MTNRFLLIALLFAGLCFSGFAHAQIPVTPEQAAQSTLTPYQIARDKAVVACTQKLNEQNLPAPQAAQFMTACVQAAGVVEPPPAPTATAGSQ